jgi:hypothetical protein
MLMAALVRILRFIGVIAMVVLLGTVAGCTRSASTLPKDAGTTAEVVLPESNPPVLTLAVAERIKPGMPQDEVLAILQDAARDDPSIKSMVDVTVTQGKLNHFRYDLTISQEKRKLTLAFRNNKLAEKNQEGWE